MIEDGAMDWGEGGPKPAAEGFDMEARQKSIYEWVRQVRGGVLGGAFTIERHMSTAIVYFCSVTVLSATMCRPRLMRGC